MIKSKTGFLYFWKMAQWLRVLAPLLGDLGSLPRILMVALSYP